MNAAKWGSLLTVLLTFAGLWAQPPGDGRRGKLEVGKLAPDFQLMGSDGKVHTLSEYRGRQAVVIAWFPRAFTGG